MSAGTGVFVGQQLIRVVQSLPRICVELLLMCSAWRVLFPILSSRRSQHLIVFLFSAIMVRNKRELLNA